jgi:hypothetical protein
MKGVIIQNVVPKPATALQSFLEMQNLQTY